MKTLFQYIKPLRFFLFWTMFFKTIAAMTDLILPRILSHIIDQVAPTVSSDRLAPIYLWGIVMVLFSAASLFFNILANRRCSRFAAKVTENLRQDLYEKILSLSSAQIDRFSISSLVTRMASDTYSINFVLAILFRAVRAPILLIGGLIMTLSSEPVLAMPLFFIVPLIVITVRLVAKKGILLHRRKQKILDRVVEKVRDTFTGIRIIKALSTGNFEKKAFGEMNDSLSDSEMKAAVTTGISSPVINLFLNIGMTLVVLLGAYRVASGNAAPGQIIAFMSYFTMILNASLTISNIFTQIANAAASADRIEEVLTAPKELEVLTAEEETDRIQEDPAFLEFKNVSFTYPSAAKGHKTLSNISFSLRRGETLGILGATGSGKSTLLQLILRFRDPDEGVILMNGRDIRTVSKKELLADIGVVFQNDFLMADRLEENIRFLRDGIGEDSLRRAAETAQAGFIDSLADGFQYTLTTGGQNLSGGQRQRVLLSRALAGDPKLILMDDSSSALDYKTDAMLRATIRKRHPNATSVVVAQRVSSVKQSDLILVIENGMISGIGTHEELISSNEIYREIAASQMGVTKK